MARRKVGNLLGLAVLAYLTQAPMHPYELSRTLRDNGDARSIKFNHGSLYMVVQQLAKAGFITEVETTRAGQRPERTVYGLTDAGRAELRDWLRELVAEPEHEYPSFVSALSLIGALHPDDAVSLLRARLDRLAERRAEIQKMVDDALAAGVLELFLIEEEYRLAQAATEADFVERLVARITDPETGWAPAWAQFHDALAAGKAPEPPVPSADASSQR
ncbi:MULTISPECIES: PadR family transcriptional regulator [unclassified Pseudofrankia]|uniref:PadR family transcriptional regulator n=1 Tax=unclassified Pseudofrankia TaxID=2994372 RepID=UPI0008DABE5A|nr:MULTISPECIES: PadR family transcriptional regulator [unclassified Pseudofrankia]MDT3445907.1 PadR family transcriptional regulator [Pseudofrankia sp. BMG5.37]OHV51362.1 PadR family transcriptional regulator [Pseudofrankia sp. BMG5.36]